MTKLQIRLGCLLAIAAAACSRQSPEPRPPSEVPSLTPASGTATSEPRQPAFRCAQNFRIFDVDGDNRVSRDEFNAQPHAHGDPAAIFAERDRDSDGVLTENELCTGFRAAPRSPGAGMEPGAGMGPGRGAPARDEAHPDVGTRRPRCEQHFDAFDADQDGKLTKEEFAARPHVHGDADTLFGERDLNDDTIITRSEFCSAWRR